MKCCRAARAANASASRSTSPELSRLADARAPQDRPVDDQEQQQRGSPERARDVEHDRIGPDPERRRNPHQSADVTCELRGMALSAASGRVLTADRMQAHNTFDAPKQVHPADFLNATVRDNRVTCSLPSMSVTVLELI